MLNLIFKKIFFIIKYLIRIFSIVILYWITYIIVFNILVILKPIFIIFITSIKIRGIDFVKILYYIIISINSYAHKQIIFIPNLVNIRKQDNNIFQFIVGILSVLIYFCIIAIPFLIMVQVVAIFWRGKNSRRRLMLLLMLLLIISNSFPL